MTLTKFFELYFILFLTQNYLLTSEDLENNTSFMDCFYDVFMVPLCPF